MKYIVVGLGNFGSSLAQKLTEQGNEVIGVDVSMIKVDANKEKISHTICIDATDAFTMSGLPFKDTDVVIVAIGENQGANIMATAVLKNLKVKRLISRAITPLHESVLQAIGVDEIVHPEEETAERWATKLSLNGIVDSFSICDGYEILEVEVPRKYVGLTLEESKIRQDFNINVLTTIKKVERRNMLGVKRNIAQVKGVATPQTLLEEGDIMVLYGEKRAIRTMLHD